MRSKTTFLEIHVRHKNNIVGSSFQGAPQQIDSISQVKQSHPTTYKYGLTFSVNATVSFICV